MSKKWEIVLRCICCLVILAFAARFIYKLWESGAFIFERTAYVSANYANWNGKEYSSAHGEYTEGRTIAKAKDGGFVINAVEEDPSHTFIVVRSFLDQYLLVANDYTIPTSGKVTTVAWNGKYISDSSFLEAVSSIQAEKTTSFTYESENIYQLTDTQHMRLLYFAYENCPVATEFIGYMGKVNGEWVITTEFSESDSDDVVYPDARSVGCYKIPSEYWALLSEYFS